MMCRDRRDASVTKGLVPTVNAVIEQPLKALTLNTMTVPPLGALTLIFVTLQPFANSPEPLTFSSSSPRLDLSIICACPFLSPSALSSSFFVLQVVLPAGVAKWLSSLQSQASPR